MHKYKYVPFIILLVVACMGAFLNYNYSHVKGEPASAADIAWMLTATGLVLLMTPGLSYFYGGIVSSKNIISTMLQSVIAMSVISLMWVVVGFSLAFGDSIGGVIGNPLTYFMFRGVDGDTHPLLSPTVPLLLFAIFIYSPLAHWTWHPDGFLRKMGVLDFAGGTVVHMSAGFAALAGAILLGRRRSHIKKEKHTPSNIPYVILGTGLLWFGWFGFNAGSALGANSLAVLAFATTNTASASAALAWIFFDVLLGRKPSASGASIGAVVGLVAITPAAGFVSVGASIFIGAIASIVSNLAVTWKSRSTLDDTLDVFPCHGLGGIVGMIMTGIFANEVGLIYGQTQIFFIHIVGLVIVSVFTFGGSFLLYKLTDFLISLRVTKEQEDIGLDLSQHDESVQQRF